jgi:1,4-dihydroxy-2-naphthoyl-CoA hydrolase
MIWFKAVTLAEVKSMMEGSTHLATAMGIEVVDVGSDYLRARMPVDQRTKMPLGLLHGGTSSVLSEPLGRYASSLRIDPDTERVVGLEINANHLRAVSDGFVLGTARPIHLGRRTHVWDIRRTGRHRRAGVREPADRGRARASPPAALVT